MNNKTKTLDVKLENKNSDNYIRKTLVSVLSALNIPSAQDIADKILQEFHSYRNLGDYEANAHKILENSGLTPQILSQRLDERAEKVYSQIEQYLPKKGSLLDLGCGDGRIGKLIADRKGLEVTLADVYKHQDIDRTGLEFVMVNPDGGIPAANKKYNDVIALTILHHCDNPINTIQEGKRVTKNDGKIIVIESVYGRKDDTDFGKLSAEKQKLACVFFDHFYNRIMHYNEDPAKKVNVPRNFNTSSGWEIIFNQNGLKQEAVRYLGIDQPLVPEYHVLYVLKK